MYENFIREYYLGDTRITKNLINYHHENREYKGLGQVSKGIDIEIKNSIDVIFYNASQDPIILKYFDFLGMCVRDYVDHYGLTGKYKSCDNNIISYFPENDGGFHQWHYERNILEPTRELAFMTYLNNVTEGGETLFKNQNKKFIPEEGVTLIWPAGFTHFHKGNTSPQEKYIATGWIKNVH